MAKAARHSAQSLRAEISARNLLALEQGGPAAELTFGRVASVLYAPEGEAGHGNFLDASFRRILADDQWAARLKKAYTGVARLPRQYDRSRGELECAGSSDALLMNVFCYPGALRRAAVCGILGIAPGLRPAFGVRAALPMCHNEVDRTELDMVLGDLYVEAKLTEGGFGRASRDRLLRYPDVPRLFSVEDLPRSGGQFVGYQIVRGVLGAALAGARYAVLLDARRADLQEICFKVLCALTCNEARSRFRLHTWQELAGGLPRPLQTFLAQRYGIEPL